MEDMKNSYKETSAVEKKVYSAELELKEIEKIK